MIEHLGIEFIELGDDYLVASMPVDHRTHQPMQ
jgi:1,4-dihydroxy-2-naphthoyl-CoA hydrolase